MRIDAHQHFWKYNPEEYSWINDDMKVIQRDFLPNDLEPLVIDFGFDGTVLVQARQILEETEWMLKLADENDFIKGVVGWVDLCSPEVEDQLKRFSGYKKLVGVRHSLQDEPDDRFMLRDDFLRGIGLLEKYQLTYDILIHPRHLPVALDLVRKFPEQPFVLDHLAKPFIKDQVVKPWSEDIKRLGSFSNVYCKLSGMVTEAAWKQWKPADFDAYIEVVYQSFGEDRIMIGSDWPVCLVAAENYGEVMNVPLDYFNTKGLSKGALGKLLGQNCSDFYQLNA